MIKRIALPVFLGVDLILGSIFISAMFVTQTAGGWAKDPGHPTIGGSLGTCFDLSVMHDGGVYKAWFSWRDKASIAYVASADGIDWSEPTIVLGPTDSGWEEIVNRPTVIKTQSGFAMWYTGQTTSRSAIGYATSPDGVSWTRAGVDPVLVASQSWEKQAVMSPDVLHDKASRLYRMWYSGGRSNRARCGGLRHQFRWQELGKRPWRPHFQWQRSGQLGWSQDNGRRC